MKILKKNSFKYIYFLLKKLKPLRKLQFFLVVSIMVTTAISEIFSLGSAIPILTLLNDPEMIWEIQLISFISQKLNIYNTNNLIILINIIFLLVVIFSILIKSFNVWIVSQYSAAIGSELSLKAFKNVLHLPYRFHKKKNSSQIISDLTNNLNSTTIALRSFFELISSSIILTGLLFFIVKINFELSSILLIIIFCIYYLIAIFVKPRLLKNSKLAYKLANLQIKTLRDSIYSIKDIIINSNQRTFISKYRTIDIPLRISQANNNFLKLFPKIIVEGSILIILGILVIVILLNNNDNQYSNFAILGALALAVTKILPSIQQIYISWATIKGYDSEIKAVSEIIKKTSQLSNNEISSLVIKTGLSLKNISFRYGYYSKYVLQKINLDIFVGDCLGIKGETGSGKSTLIDIIIGLLKPDYGNILIDDQNLHGTQNNNLSNRWRNQISHVPQDIFLLDASISENIAFGIDKKNIDIDKVQKVAEVAMINSFIESLPKKYETVVGEKGNKLSGGQKQRIAIARALYNDKQVLILDEATSALDKKTERILMNSLKKYLHNSITIIISHNIKTLSYCNRLVEIKDSNLLEINNNNIKKMF